MNNIRILSVYFPPYATKIFTPNLALKINSNPPIQFFYETEKNRNLFGPKFVTQKYLPPSQDGVPEHFWIKYLDNGAI